MRDISPDNWLVELTQLAKEGFRCLELLTVVDRGTTLEVIARILDTDQMAPVMVSTRVPADAPAVDSIVPAFPAAAWYEREAAEMFGVQFLGHPDPRPLLTDGGQPPLLRKSTPLAARVDTPWPGVDATSRRRARVPGVSDEWIDAS